MEFGKHGHGHKQVMRQEECAGFHSLGLKEGDHIAILSKNCAQWIIADIAIMMAGCVSIQFIQHYLPLLLSRS
jgi:long-subunit acyl-CoA synthetase (AMP-forming)